MNLSNKDSHKKLFITLNPLLTYYWLSGYLIFKFIRYDQLLQSAFINFSIKRFLFYHYFFKYNPTRQLLLEKYGEDLALKLMGSRNEFNYEMTTIMSDEDLMKMGIYENRTENATPKDTSFQVSQEYLKRII